ncbi:hypothetical protein Rumeso_01968 [Rubellimicrobium mesophilum DSM 19309]|uniref:Uncharacterized protein n=1 Tax=Rubellimicrobium mesophilum DSM 19309 TaxID=442562 RepID=A0A017HQ12_9RHOB|nr:hypothetical protein Rumeso_01968 [Rubellimicrobium mesophilum DSM 19309]
MNRQDWARQSPFEHAASAEPLEDGGCDRPQIGLSDDHRLGMADDQVTADTTRCWVGGSK